MYGKLLIAISVLLNVVACAGAAYPISTPVSSSQALSVLEEIEPCPPQYCWNGVPLRDLDIDTVTKIISQKPGFSDTSPKTHILGDDYVAYVWSPQQLAGETNNFFQYTTHGNEFFLLTRIFPSIRLSDVLSMFGEPSHILVSEGGSAPSHGPWIHFVIYYEKDGMMFTSDVVRYTKADEDESYSIFPNATIISYDLTFPKSVSELIRTQLLARDQSSFGEVDKIVPLWEPFVQRWRGYGDYIYMKEWEGLLPEYR